MSGSFTAGVSLVGVRVSIDLPRMGGHSTVGDILFTHTGLSGPAVLDISGLVAQLLAKHKYVPLRIGLVSDGSPGGGTAPRALLLKTGRAPRAVKGIRMLLNSHMPARLAGEVIALCDIDITMTAAHLDDRRRRLLLDAMAGLRIDITGTEGFDKAMVTRGGVSLKHVNPTRWKAA